MKKPLSLLIILCVVLAAYRPLHAASAGSDAAALADLARGHERVFKSLGTDHVAVVLQKGDKQFTIYGVVEIRAVGAVLEITVKNGEKYSVSPADVFFITNNGFKI